MSKRTIHHCDACGVEYEEAEYPLGVAAAHSNQNWGHLHLGYGGAGGVTQGLYGLAPMPLMLDICEGCVKKVAAAIGVKLPPPPKADDWPVVAGSMIGGPTCTPAFGRRSHLRPVPEGGGLTAEDLKALGLDVDELQANAFTPAPGVDLMTGTFTCPKCSAQCSCQSFNPTCLSCGHQDPDVEKYGGCC